MDSPALRQMPRSQPAQVIPVQRDASILSWLESTGRLIPREPVDSVLDEPDSEEISDLMGADDGGYDDDDDVELDDDD